MTDRAKSPGAKFAGGKSSGTRSAGANRVRKHREKMKAAGLKPVTIWVPDTSAPGFQDDIRRQCRQLKDDPQEAIILAEIEQWSDHEGWK